MYTKEDIDLYASMQEDPNIFVQKVWGLMPQKTKDDPFIKGVHYTWQQYELLNAIKKALAGEAPRRISVRSGHGTGKSSSLSWVIFWYLFCFKDSQIPCTAPTSTQMHDVLWKELSLWHQRMPEWMKPMFEISQNYVRVTESPDTWFARARTATKENPEALAGVHADHVLIPVDEASGIPEEIFNTAEGALTNPNILVILISNPTRLIGYFYDSHHDDKANWQALHFSSEDSPIVDKSFVERIVSKHGPESDEYAIRVRGEFPRSDALDDKGYVPLMMQEEVKYSDSSEIGNKPKLGVDPSGEGSNKTEFVVRDNFNMVAVASEAISDGKSIAKKTKEIMKTYGIVAEDVFIDGFGTGMDAIMELASDYIIVNAVNVGEKPFDPETFLNQRAEYYWAYRKWLITGGKLYHKESWKQLFTIKFKRNLRGLIQIMPKQEMIKEGMQSPDRPDAGMLTFARGKTRVRKVGKEQMPKVLKNYGKKW